MRNVCILSELYYPERTVPAPILTSISEGLASRANVHVICSQPTYSVRGIRALKKEILHGVHIHRVASTTLDKDVLFFRLLNFITISLSICIASLREIKRNDVVFVVTNPPILPFLVAFVCAMKRAKTVLIVHDVYPEVLITAGMLKADSLPARIGYAMTRRLYRSCDSLVVIGRDMEHLAESKLGCADRKIRLIPNWADVEYITPGDRKGNVLLNSLHIADKFVVQYSGNMGRTHDLEDLYDAARRLEKRADIHFLFIGSGAKKRWLEKSAARDRLGNVTILPPRTREELPDSLNACDVAVIAFTAGMSGVSVPSRMYNVMAAGKPIVAVADGDSKLALVVTEENAGWVVPPGNPAGVVELLLYAQAHPGECREKGLNGRRAVETKYTFAQVLPEYEKLIEDVSAG